jgi:hypothetical protein
MRKFLGTVSAAALIAMIGIWSQTALVTKAAGLVHDIGGLRTGERTATAKIADRFPDRAEMFQPFAYLPQRNIIDSKTMVVALGNGDRPLGNIASCGEQNWPFIATDCFVAAKDRPAPEANPTVTIEGRIGNTSEPVRAPITAVVRPSCKQDLAAASAIIERAMARSKVRDTRGGADVCDTYRRDFFELVKARGLMALCKTGAERSQDLGRIDVAVEDINGAIARSCRT